MVRTCNYPSAKDVAVEWFLRPDEGLSSRKPARSVRTVKAKRPPAMKRNTRGDGLPGHSIPSDRAKSIRNDCDSFDDVVATCVSLAAVNIEFYDSIDDFTQMTQQYVSDVLWLIADGKFDIPNSGWSKAVARRAETEWYRPTFTATRQSA